MAEYNQKYTSILIILTITYIIYIFLINKTTKIEYKSTRRKSAIRKFQPAINFTEIIDKFLSIHKNDFDDTQPIDKNLLKKYKVEQFMKAHIEEDHEKHRKFAEFLESELARKSAESNISDTQTPIIVLDWYAGRTGIGMVKKENLGRNWQLVGHNYDYYRVVLDRCALKMAKSSKTSILRFWGGTT